MEVDVTVDVENGGRWMGLFVMDAEMIQWIDQMRLQKELSCFFFTIGFIFF